MKYHWLLPLLSAVLNLLLGIIVIARDRRARLNRVFLGMSITLSLWNLNNFVFYVFSDPAKAMTWGTFFRVGTVLMPSTVLHLVLSLVAIRPVFARWMLVGSYGISTLLVIANFSGMLVSSVRQHPWGLYPAGTALYGFYLISAVVHCIIAFALLVLEYRTSTSPWRKLQARFWLLGAAIAIPAGLVNFLPMYGVPVYPIGHLGNAIYAAIIAYAIARHRLMDVDLVITKGMAYAAVSIALVAPTFASSLWLQQASFGQVHPDFSFALLVMLIAVGVLFPTLRVRAESRIERSLFREKHQYRTALADFTRSIVRILDRDKLLREVAETLMETLRVDRLGIVLFDEATRSYQVTHTAGIPAATGEFGEQDEFVVALRRHDELVLRDEFEASADPMERTVVADVCRRNGWDVCIPLTISGRLMGFISLGRKRNLDAFSVEDLQLLSTLAAEVSIALENARLYGELKRSRDIIERTGRLSALGTLAAGIAHEVRNPLVSIQTFFQLAPQRIHDEEFFTTFLNLTAGEVQRISNLITELLTFARSSTHAVSDVDVNELIERTTLLLEPEARKHRVTLTRTLAESLPNIRADADQIKQVVINLVLNAIQATAVGGSVVVQTRQRRHTDGLFCEIEVRDSGAGIPSQIIDEIFNPFFTTKDSGTGLGLSIAHQIAAEHGGFISVRSEEGRGSSFCVNLPYPGDSETAGRQDEEDEPLRYGRLAKG